MLTNVYVFKYMHVYMHTYGRVAIVLHEPNNYSVC